ncbi:MAG: GDCCVxC domain-containing (seleno)protein [Gammaproteobacteria bacterium]
MTVGKATVLICTLTCPRCGNQCSEEMPTDACVRFYECTQCHTLLKPLTGDCCVFCSYGSIPCPPQQQAGACCHA